MSKFAFQKSTEGDATVFHFQGHIDEDASFANLDFGGAMKIVVSLEKVSAINSCGIREWIKWIRTAPAGSQITYRKCPKVIVDQINMVSGFLPENGKVESFYVPYYSENAGTEKMILFETGVHFADGKINAPDEVKDDAGEVMEMDVIEAKYFKFLHK
jgi:hypothetical protein